MRTQAIRRIVESRLDEDVGLIAILQDIQDKFSYLPEEALRVVAERTGKSLVDIYGVATFYRSFSLQPKGRHLVSVCLGTACHVRGGPGIVQEFERQLGVLAGETTPDREFSLEAVNCLGACALGPIVAIDGRYFSNVKVNQVKKILAGARSVSDSPGLGQDDHTFPVEVSCARCNHSLMDQGYAIDGYPSIKLTISFGAKHGWQRLSSLYGSYQVFNEYEVPPDSVAHFFCPHCHSELPGSSTCADCGAPMVHMSVRGGGMVQICTRRGCRSHMLDVNGVNL